jgi:hypothetical protein
LPDSGAELPFAGRDGLFARMSRRSRAGLDRTVGRQEPGSGSAHTKTLYKALDRHMPRCLSDASSRTPCVRILATFTAPPAGTAARPDNAGIRNDGIPHSGHRSSVRGWLGEEPL